MFTRRQRALLLTAILLLVFGLILALYHGKATVYIKNPGFHINQITVLKSSVVSFVGDLQRGDQVAKAVDDSKYLLRRDEEEELPIRNVSFETAITQLGDNFETTDKEIDDWRGPTIILDRSNHTTANSPLPPPLRSTLSEGACAKIGQNQIFTGSKVWKKFLTMLERYATFHKEQLIQLKSGNRKVPTLTWSCYDSHGCSGIGDQMSRILQLLLYSMMSDRVFLLYWDEVSQQTMQYLQPNKIDWSYFNEELGMHKHVERELERLPFVKPDSYDKLFKLLSNKRHTHVTMNHELLVPFFRGFNKALSWCTKNTGNGICMQINAYGVREVLSAKGSSKFFLGELLRYLFRFSQDVIDAVDQIQKSLGIFNTSYLGVHMRTGFLGTKFEEKGQFSKKKIYRDSKDWESTVTCSLKLADKFIGSNVPIFLATDSYLVKYFVKEKFSERVCTSNATLQHVASVTGNHLENNHQVTDYRVQRINGYMSTWVDFLLLARSSILVHSISGFASVAGQYCSITSQYFTPWCTKTPKLKKDNS